jgi:phospholipase C
MRCFTPDQLPVLTTLAREFAICDQWFSSLPGPTWPNRFFLLAASSGGLDGSPSNLDVVTSTTIEGYRFSNGNVFDLLDQYCIEWKIFEGDEFPVSFALSGMNLNALQGRFDDFENFASALQSASFGPKFVFIEPKYGAHDFDVTGPGDFTCGNSMHPLDDVTRGEKLVKDVYEAIRNSPHWERSLLVVTFDEHGGFYDHVPPPAAVPPDDDRHEYAFDRYGVRVPALLISPWVERSVITTRFDHTSLLRYLSDKYALRPLGRRVAEAASFGPELLKLRAARRDTPAKLLRPPALARARVPRREPPMPSDLNEHQRALLAFTEYLDTLIVEPPTRKAVRKRAFESGISGAVEAAKERVARFLDQQRKAARRR